MANEELAIEIKKILTLPKRLREDGSISRDMVSDAVMLSSCGCVVSEPMIQQLQGLDYTNCPICSKQMDYKYNPVRELRALYEVSDRLNHRETITPHTSNESMTASLPSMSSSDWNRKDSNKNSTKNQNLLSLFYKVANNVTDTTEELTGKTETPEPDFTHESRQIMHSFRRDSSSVEPNEIKLDKGSCTSTTEFTVNQHYYPSLASTESSKEANKEKLFVRNFPRLKKQFQYHTSSTRFLHFSKTRNFINNSISPSCKYFALLTPSIFKVYETNTVYRPKLLFCGNKSGEVGTDLTTMKKDLTKLSKFYQIAEIVSRLSHWEFLYCKITEKFLVISGTNGILLIYSIKDLGKPVYIYFSSFPIRCISISQDSKIIAYGITGKDRINNSEQTLVVMHKLTLSSEPQDLDELQRVNPITITFPYKDPINKISFSKDSRYLTCSTAIESRFLIISIKDPFSPKLIMKSIKSIDTSLESEGITDLQLFPNNRFMIVTSVGFNSPSIIIDNNISTINGLQTVAHPKLVLKLNELGSNLHQCAISPRDDSIAVIDKNGMVYLITMNKINSTDFDHINNKKLFIIDQVSNSFSIKESASLAWDENGYRLFIVDRKGVLYINDFIAGETNSESLVKSKIIT